MDTTFVQTQHNTIRVLVHSNENELLKSVEFSIFESICSNKLKLSENLYSWEIPMLLLPFLHDKYKNNPNVKFEVSNPNQFKKLNFVERIDRVEEYEATVKLWIDNLSFRVFKYVTEDKRT